MNEEDTGLLGTLEELYQDLEVAIQEIKLLLLQATSKLAKYVLTEVLDALEEKKTKAAIKIQEIQGG